MERICHVGRSGGANPRARAVGDAKIEARRSKMEPEMEAKRGKMDARRDKMEARGAGWRPRGHTWRPRGPNIANLSQNVEKPMVF